MASLLSMHAVISFPSPSPVRKSSFSTFNLPAPSPIASLHTPVPRPCITNAATLEDASKQTVDYFVRNGMTVGLGTGRGSCMAIVYLGQKLRAGGLRDVRGVPMSSFSAAEAAKAGIPLFPFEEGSKIDFAFTDADVVQEGTLFAVIGRKGVPGRESIIKEKAIASLANQFAFIIDEPKFAEQLDGAVPVLIEQDNWIETAEEIDDLFLGDAEVWRRPTFGEAGPLGGDFPLITAEGHFVLDLIFTSPISNPVKVAESLESLDRVIEHGLILDAVYAAAVASLEGVKIRTSLFKNSFTPIE
eukprot:c21222_g2_i1 orf=348-1250(-)